MVLCFFLSQQAVTGVVFNIFYLSCYFISNQKYFYLGISFHTLSANCFQEAIRKLILPKEYNFLRAEYSLYSFMVYSRFSKISLTATCGVDSDNRTWCISAFLREMRCANWNTDILFE